MMSGDAGIYISQSKQEKGRQWCQKPASYQLTLLPNEGIPLQSMLEVLRLFCQLEEQEALAMAIDLYGYGQAASCGSYSFDIAHTKKIQMESYLSAKGYQLACEVWAKNA
ncbi:MAG TPA: ATP-dependent Clp protease adaptor ClpS [Alcanivoracaceae bacterium]|nr:ATP-dependent Clp protease adaptor ClpS [Alcanivoracaceae bacterium]